MSLVNPEYDSLAVVWVTRGVLGLITLTEEKDYIIRNEHRLVSIQYE